MYMHLIDVSTLYKYHLSFFSKLGQDSLRQLLDLQNDSCENFTQRVSMDGRTNQQHITSTYTEDQGSGMESAPRGLRNLKHDMIYTHGSNDEGKSYLLWSFPCIRIWG
jgi:hypothetical protein